MNSFTSLARRSLEFARTIEPFVSRYRLAFSVVACTVAGAVYLAPMLWSGTTDFDYARAHYAAVGPRAHLSVADALLRNFTAESRSTGGWFPLAAVVPTLWTAFPSIETQRAIEFALILANFATAMLLAYRLSGSLAFAASAISLTFVALQIRAPHDALLSVGIDTVGAAEAVLLSLVLVTPARDFGVRLGIVGLIAYVVATVSTIFAYPLVVLFAVSAFRARGLRRRLLIAAACTPVVALTISVASHAATPRVFATAAHSLPTYVRAVCVAAFAALPTAYRSQRLNVSMVNDFVVESRFHYFPFISQAGWFAAIMIASIAYVAISHFRRQLDRDRSSVVALVSGTLWIGTAMCVGFRPLWNDALPFGQASDSVYLECFGFGFAVAAALEAVVLSKWRWSSIVAPVIAFEVLFGIYGNVRTNSVAIEASRTLDAFRRNVAAGAAHGLFTTLPDGATMAVSDSVLRYGTAVADGRSIVESALYQYTGKAFAVIPYRLARMRTGEAWAISSDTYRNGPPGMTLYHLPAGSMLRTDSSVRYVDYGSADDRRAKSVAFAAKGRGYEASIAFVGESASIISVRRECGPVELADAFAADAPRLAWSIGFRPPTPDYGRQLTFALSQALPPGPPQDPPYRYGGHSATIHIEQDTCPPVPLTFTGTLIAAFPSSIQVSVAGRTASYVASQAGGTVRMRIPAITQPRFDIRFQSDTPIVRDIAILPRTERYPEPDDRFLLVSPAIGVVRPKHDR